MDREREREGERERKKREIEAEIERENDANVDVDDAGAITPLVVLVAPNVVVAATIAASVAHALKPQEKRSSHLILCHFSNSGSFLIEDHTKLKQ